MPKKDSEPFYRPRSNGDAMRRAARVKGLGQEIALLRVKLQEFVEADPIDEGLILSAVNALGRAMMAQARIQGVDPGDASKRMAAAIRQLGLFLEEDHRP
jgi:hypothetical protein